MSSSGLDPAHVAWCGRHFAMLREGGLWAVPRSGLVFAKRAGRFVLVKAMPWEPAMAGTLSAEQLREWQEVDFQDIRVHFGAAGIDVVKEDPMAPTDPEREAATKVLREHGKRRNFLLKQLAKTELALEAAIVAADSAHVPRREIAREAGVVRQTVYNILARQGREEGAA